MKQMLFKSPVRYDDGLDQRASGEYPGYILKAELIELLMVWKWAMREKEELGLLYTLA